MHFLGRFRRPVPMGIPSSTHHVQQLFHTDLADDLVFDPRGRRTTLPTLERSRRRFEGLPGRIHFAETVLRRSFLWTHPPNLGSR